MVSVPETRLRLWRPHSWLASLGGSLHKVASLTLRTIGVPSQGTSGPINRQGLATLRLLLFLKIVLFSFVMAHRDTGSCGVCKLS